MFLTLEFEGVLIPFVEEIQYNLIIHEYIKALAPPTIEIIVELWLFFLLQIHMGMSYPPLAS